MLMQDACQQWEGFLVNSSSQEHSAEEQRSIAYLHLRAHSKLDLVMIDPLIRPSRRIPSYQTSHEGIIAALEPGVSQLEMVRCSEHNNGDVGGVASAPDGSCLKSWSAQHLNL